jgi:hypothetical protein
MIKESSCRESVAWSSGGPRQLAENMVAANDALERYGWLEFLYFPSVAASSLKGRWMTWWFKCILFLR